MARDLDFIARPRVNPNSTPTRPIPSKPLPAPVTPPRVAPLPQSIINHSKAQKRSKLALWVWIVIVLLLVAWGIFFYYLSLKPTTVSQKNAPTASAKPLPNPTDTLLGSQTAVTEPQVTLYNSGGGSDAVKALEATLKTQGYTTQDLGNSEFQLDQTYIWYQAAYLSDVQKIQELLAGKKVALRPYSGTGPYKILIQLGP